MTCKNHRLSLLSSSLEILSCARALILRSTNETHKTPKDFELFPNFLKLSEKRSLDSGLGFTEAHRVEDSAGDIWTVFRNPETGEWSGGHLSSNQNRW